MSRTAAGRIPAAVGTPTSNDDAEDGDLGYAEEEADEMATERLICEATPLPLNQQQVVGEWLVNATPPPAALIWPQAMG